MQNLMKDAVGIPAVARGLEALVKVMKNPVSSLTGYDKGDLGIVGGFFQDQLASFFRGNSKSNQTSQPWEKNLPRDSRENFSVQSSSGGSAKGFINTP